MQDTRYEQVGRFIYGFQRVLGRLDVFCKALERQLGQDSSPSLTMDSTMSEVGERAAGLLARHFGAEALIVHEFRKLLESLRANDALMADIKAGAGVGEVRVPDDDEIARLLGCQPELERFSQRVAGT